MIKNASFLTKFFKIKNNILQLNYYYVIKLNILSKNSLPLLFLKIISSHTFISQTFNDYPPFQNFHSLVINFLNTIHQIVSTLTFNSFNFKEPLYFFFEIIQFLKRFPYEYFISFVVIGI